MGIPEDTSATTHPSDASSTNPQPATDWEKRYKDTQVSYTKGQQEIKRLRAEMGVLRNSAPQPQIDPAVREELEDLKYSDPEAWRTKVNNIEAEAKASYQAKLDEATTVANQEFELERRAQVLADFSSSRNFELTDEIIQNDIPPKFTKKLEQGDITFEEFLEESYSYLTKRTVDNPGVSNQPNINKTSGGGTPSDPATNGDIIQTYSNEVY